MSLRRQPAFITFTGADDAALCKGMSELSAKYPIEWGILIDRDKKGTSLFPSDRCIDQFRRRGVRLCAHICGSFATEIAEGADPKAYLAGFSRIQVNYGRGGATDAVVNMVNRFASKHGVRGVLQCREQSFPTVATKVDWLFDVSFGEGVRPKAFPAIATDHPFCGISGGIGPDNVFSTLDEKIEVVGDSSFWLDMESGVRSSGAFDLKLCEAVCKAVFG